MTEETIFATALDKQTPAERSAFLDKACAGDTALRRRIESLIAAHEQAEDFLEQPALEQIAAGLPPSRGPTEAIKPAADAITGKPAKGLLGPTQAEPAANSDDDISLDFLAPSDRADALGRIDHYHVLAIIGRGGMGVVLKAFDQELQRVVAIKVMAPQLAATATARKRFRREAAAAAAVRDEHVIDIHAVDEVNGLPYLVMEYVSGISLQDRLDQSGPLEVKEILRIGMQMANGLAKAHAQGLIHRDIKPANILLENGVQRVKITDFGLARAVDDASLTQSGVIAGTPQYMAPEQASGSAVDHRADLFSLGSVLYTMCTGRPPFRASTVMAVLKRVCEDASHPIREINPDIPDWLAAIIDKLHAKDPAQRFQTAREVAELLGQHLAHLQQPTLVAMPPYVERPYARAATTRRKRRLLAPVLMMLTPILFIPVLMAAIWLLRGSPPLWLIGFPVAVSVSVAVTGFVLLIVRLSARGEPERAAPLPSEEWSISSQPRERSLALPCLGTAALVMCLGCCLLGIPAALLYTWTQPEASIQIEESQAIAEEARATLTGHVLTAPVAAFSPDRKTLATADRGGNIYIWEAATGKRLHSFPAHGATIWSLAYSSDGKRLVSASWDQTAKIWDTATRQLRATLEGHTDRLWWVGFAPGDKTLATASEDGTVRIWEAAAGKEQRRLEHGGPVYCAVFRRGGKMLATGTVSGLIRLWDTPTWENRTSLQGHLSAIRLAFSADGTTLAAASQDRTLSLWDVTLGRKITSLTGFREMVESVAFAPDGKLLATGGGNWRDLDVPGEVTIWDVAARKLVARLNGHTSCVHCVTFSPDGKTLASASNDSTVKLWDVPRWSVQDRSRGCRIYCMWPVVHCSGLIASPQRKQGREEPLLALRADSPTIEPLGHQFWR